MDVKNLVETELYGELSFVELTYLHVKHRKIRVAGAPKYPLTGYIRYMNERREILRKVLPNKTAIQHTKIIGHEWNLMMDHQRAPYLEAAELDKQRYDAELRIFLKDHPNLLANVLGKDKNRKNRTTTMQSKSTQMTPCDELRNCNMYAPECDAADAELENDELKAQIERLKIVVAKARIANVQLKKKNRKLKKCFNTKKRRLAAAFSGIPLPTAPRGATVENIEKYIADLYTMCNASSRRGAMLDMARHIIRSRFER